MVEFKNKNELETWLKGKPKEFSVVIASRAALRVLPVLEELFEKNKNGSLANATIKLIVFRAILLLMETSKFPKYYDVSPAYSSAAFAAGGVVSISDSVVNSSDIDVFKAIADAGRTYIHLGSFSAGFASQVCDTTSAIVADHGIINDLRHLELGVMPDQLAQQRLWEGDMPPELIKKWRNLKQNLLTLDENWQIWTDWYEDIVAGRNRAGLPDDLAKELDLKIATQENEWWKRSPAKVNGDIKRWTADALEEAKKRATTKEDNETDSIIEPEAVSGPQYDIVDGKLSIVAHLPAENELAAQAGLHQNLQQQAGVLNDAVSSLQNQYPALVNTIREYSGLLDKDIEALDITGVWSVGGALTAFQQAYVQQNQTNTLEIPLEPNIVAQLQSVVRMHGAFILGFDEGRDLVERADAFSMDAALLVEIEVSGNEIFDELTDDRELVDEDVRALHGPVRDAVHELGWSAGRIGYAAYVIIKNTTLTLTKRLVGSSPNVGSILGLLAAGSMVAGAPSMEAIRNAVFYLQTYGPRLLSFFNHSPEMRAYIEHALKMIVDFEK